SSWSAATPSTKTCATFASNSAPENSRKRTTRKSSSHSKLKPPASSPKWTALRAALPLPPRARPPPRRLPAHEDSAGADCSTILACFATSLFARGRGVRRHGHRYDHERHNGKARRGRGCDPDPASGSHAARRADENGRGG